MEILRISFQNLENPFRIFKILIPGRLGTSAALDPKTTIQKRLETIKSKREGSLRGGDEKVFVFYSGTIFSQRHFFYETFDAFLCHLCPRNFFCFAQKPQNDVRNG